MLRHVGLDKHRAALGVEAGGQKIEQNVDRILLYARGVGVISGEGMPVGNEEIAFVLVLHTDPVVECADKVAEMQLAGGAHATENTFAMWCGRRHQMLIKMEM